MIRHARPAEAEVLSDLALRSKAHWGYSQEFLAACKGELSYSAEQLNDEQSDFFVAKIASTTVGFYAISRIDAENYELAALFLEPKHIGRGLGRRLLQHALRKVASRGGLSLLVQSDPQAAKFYAAAGGKRIGSRESGSVRGRLLPLFRIDIAAPTDGDPRS